MKKFKLVLILLILFTFVIVAVNFPHKKNNHLSFASKQKIKAMSSDRRISTDSKGHVIILK